MKIFFCEQLLGKITLLKDKIYHLGILLKLVSKFFLSHYVNSLTIKKKKIERKVNEFIVFTGILNKIILTEIF